jgi:S1-C subfamily serine protease
MKHVKTDAMRGGLSLSSLLPLTILAACAQPVANNANGPIDKVSSVKVGDTTYSSAAAALDAVKRNDQRFVDGVADEPDPMKGSLRIVLPDHDRLRPLLAQQAQQATKKVVQGEALDLVIEQTRIEQRALADSVIKAKEFASVTVTEQNDVIDPGPGGAEFVLWYQVRTAQANNTGNWIGQWLVKRSGSAIIQNAGTDAGTAAGTPRYQSFVKSVREAALRLGGKSIAGASPSAAPGAVASQGSSGTGIVIDGRGHVVTNEHVIRTCPQLRIVDASNQTYAATITAKDAANDLALLTAEHHWTESASFRDGQEIRPGDAVVATGYPLTGLLGSGMSVTTGSLTSLTGPRDDSRLMQMSAPIQPGNSGGPLLDSTGHVVGVVSSQLNAGLTATLTGGAVPQNVNFAVKAAIVRTFLETQGVRYARAPSSTELAPSAVGELARKFTVRVECRNS